MVHAGLVRQQLHTTYDSKGSHPFLRVVLKAYVIVASLLYGGSFVVEGDLNGAADSMWNFNEHELVQRTQNLGIRK